jgi:CRISPR-associated protein Cas1
LIKHFIITEPNGYLHYKEGLAVFSRNKEVLEEVSLRRLKTIQVLSKHISISSYLIFECSKNAIQIFFINYFNQIVAMISGTHLHATTQLRKKQFEFIESSSCFITAKQIVIGKIKNQRNLLLYFNKYHSQEELKNIEKRFLEIIKEIEHLPYSPFWKQKLLGLEGLAAKIYWDYLKEVYFKDFHFPGRIPRVSPDIINSCLNLGYTILLNMVWRAVSISGLEPYAGIYHSDRSGKPSLVLDLMEEFRPWVVDRNVIKIRNELKDQTTLKETTKKKFISLILDTFSSEFSYDNKRCKLETILQRQIYRFCGTIVNQKPYKNYIFRW